MTVKLKKKKVTDFVLTFSAGAPFLQRPVPGDPGGQNQEVTPQARGCHLDDARSGGTAVILTLGRYTASKPLALMVSAGPTGANGAASRPSSPAFEEGYTDRHFGSGA